jgi:hypothetical protein
MTDEVVAEALIILLDEAKKKYVPHKYGTDAPTVKKIDKTIKGLKRLTGDNK